jgi:hypothetical protein
LEIDYFNLSTLISLKKKLKKFFRAATIIIARKRALISGLNDYITASRIGKMRLAKILGIPYKTFYRKVRNGKFNDKQFERLIHEVEKAKAELYVKKIVEPGNSKRDRKKNSENMP